MPFDVLPSCFWLAVRLTTHFPHLCCVATQAVSRAACHYAWCNQVFSQDLIASLLEAIDKHSEKHLPNFFTVLSAVLELQVTIQNSHASLCVLA